MCAMLKRTATIVVLVLWTALPLYGQSGSEGRSSPRMFPGAPSLTGLIAALPGFSDGFDPRRVKFTPSGRIGYQRISMDLRMPVPFKFSVDSTGTYAGEATVLKLRDANLWVGEAGLDAQLTTRINMFTNGSANLIQSLVASTAPDIVGRTKVAEWKKNQLQWIQVEGGAGFTFRAPFSVIAGLRWDRFGLVLQEPVGLTNVNAGPYQNLTLIDSEVSSRFWIPYFGIGLTGKDYRARLIGSPIVSASIQVHTRLSADILPSYSLLGDGIVTMEHPGGFLEAGLEYTATVFQSTRVNLWAKAGWLGIRGRSQTETAYTTSYPNVQVGSVQGSSVFFTRYNVAAGLSVNASF